ncbi:PP2C family protein-serine/threonine phosphatase [Leptothermofonsia sp. ETS-13]|uniref:PP2C family protein-serine/threonine phosphatase n=1 Tax=Leptothermofonsia sp. ETS-13 TaxID=3035696 RepID=UPI003B9F6B25
MTTAITTQQLTTNNSYQIPGFNIEGTIEISMHSDAVTIFCPNPLCLAPNPESHRFCCQCRTPIPKRYLWATGKGVSSLQPDSFLGSRYLLKQGQIVLDTQPGILPELPEDIPSAVEIYLKLSNWQLHVPQVFGLVSTNQKRSPSEILLLEKAPIYPEGVAISPAAPLEGTLMPALTDLWAESSSMRQLTWLWQSAQLWQPLSVQGVASTLLNPDLLRVEGSLLRLLELQTDSRSEPSLAHLGQLWQQWQPTVQMEIADFFAQLCQQLLQGQIWSAEQLVAVLDRALRACGQAQSRQIQIATRTDQGPSRQRNEDACYPPSGTALTISIGEDSKRLFEASGKSSPLVVVCDGIGGHEGGEVASNLAIATIQQKLQRLSQSAPLEPTTLVTHLEQATLAANDVISQRNDNEQRQERQRMGTTLVMSLVQDHELYLTHVGDSRAYRISRTGCHQVTLDDDLASREVRLGYALYRDALQQPGSGSLIQALGMNASSLLHPTVQRFILDEDCLFLLCSDGLSDNDRVEQHWQTELLPILEGVVDVATASQRLVAIANQENGHDNVTVGLVYCRMNPVSQSLLAPLDPALAVPPPNPGGLVSAGSDLEASFSSPPTLRTRAIRCRSNPRPFLLGVVGILAVGGLAAFWAFPGLRSQFSPPIAVSSSPSEPVVSPLPPTPPPPPSPPPPLTVGSLIQINRLIPSGNQSVPIALLPQPPKAGVTQGIATSGTVPIGSVLQISSRQSIPNQGNWLKLKVCSVPADISIDSQPVQAGQVGWLEEDAIAPLVTQELALTPTQLGTCAATPPAQATKPEPVSPRVKNEEGRR